LNLIDLRGNVDTRLRKLRDQNLNGIILAQAGLIRLGFENQITERLDPEWMLPAVGQGAIGLECREDNAEAVEALRAINDPKTWNAVLAERSMLFALGGGCLVPIGVQSIAEAETLTLRAAVLSQDGRQRIYDQISGASDRPQELGALLAGKLLDAGAKQLLLN
jgi:hydroxymethylbilane synthase